MAGINMAAFNQRHPYKVARADDPSDVLYHSSTCSNAEYVAFERQATVWHNGQQISDAAQCARTWQCMRDKGRQRRRPCTGLVR
jgi:hypothetical protein